MIVVSALPCHFLNNHGVVGSPFGFVIGSSVSYGCGLEQIPWSHETTWVPWRLWVELLVPGACGLGQTLWSPKIA